MATIQPTLFVAPAPPSPEAANQQSVGFSEKMQAHLGGSDRPDPGGGPPKASTEGGATTSGPNAQSNQPDSLQNPQISRGGKANLAVLAVLTGGMAVAPPPSPTAIPANGPVKVTGIAVPQSTVAAVPQILPLQAAALPSTPISPVALDVNPVAGDLTAPTGPAEPTAVAIPGNAAPGPGLTQEASKATPAPAQRSATISPVPPKATAAEAGSDRPKAPHTPPQAPDADPVSPTAQASSLAKPTPTPPRPSVAPADAARPRPTAGPIDPPGSQLKDASTPVASVTVGNPGDVQPVATVEVSVALPVQPAVQNAKVAGLQDLKGTPISNAVAGDTPIRPSSGGEPANSQDSSDHQGAPQHQNQPLAPAPSPQAPEAASTPAVSAPAVSASSSVPSTAHLSVSDRIAVVKQVANRIEMMVAAKPQSAVTVRLQPQGLGDVTVVVKNLGRAIEATLSASNESVHAALSDSKDALSQAVAAKGYNLVGVHVATQASGSQTAGKQAPSQQQQQAGANGSTSQGGNAQGEKANRGVRGSPDAPPPDLIEATTWQTATSSLNYLI